MVCNMSIKINYIQTKHLFYGHGTNKQGNKLVRRVSDRKLVFHFKEMHGYKMENIVTFSIAYITLSESFQTMPVGTCKG